MSGALRTLLVLALCWPAWELGGWIADAAGLAMLDLPVRAALLVLLLNRPGEWLDRNDRPEH